MAIGIAVVKTLRNINEPLYSELRLGAPDWRYRAHDCVRASEAAALNMIE